MKHYSIAIDGPAGAGKSTMAKRLAQALGYVYVDTGAIYRTVGYHMNLMGIGPKDAAGINRLIGDVNLDITYDAQGTQHMILNGADVSDEIRTPEMSMIASTISAHKVVRDFLLDTQRDLAKAYNVVMDGRDIGTVVLPDADLKIYLTASPEARAMRRYQEYLDKGQKATYEEVLEDQKKRDYDDSHRKIAPLKQAKDAILVDTTEMGLQESVDYCVSLIREKLGL